LFGDTYREYRDKIVKDAVLIVEGVVSEDDYSGGLRMRASGVKTLLEARSQYVKGIRVEMHREKLRREAIANLSEILKPYREGACPVVIRYTAADAEADLQLAAEWNVTPDDDLLNKLRDGFGTASVQLQFH